MGLVVLVMQLGAAKDRKSMLFTMQTILTLSIDKTVVTVKTINVKGTFTYFLQAQFVSVTQSRCGSFKFAFLITCFNPLSFAFRQEKRYQEAIVSFRGN